MSLTGLRVRPASSGRPSLSAMALRSGTQTHLGPLGTFQEMEWSSLQASSPGFDLLSGRVVVPKAGVYLCTASFTIVGVASLTALSWDWKVDNVAQGILASTTVVPAAGGFISLSASAELEITDDITLEWNETGATGTSLGGNSSLSLLFLRGL